ncbi:MAG: YicC family protein [Alphaproteobacteria bacterium]|nr:YicC family protein [Alphaproteobacteria bacterium]
MVISSMTGFARTEGGRGAADWVWEVRSVNSRGLDVRCRLPQGLDRLESPARKAAGDRFKRGAVSMNLTILRAAGEGRLRVNRALLKELQQIKAELGDAVDPAAPRLEGLLGVRGLIEQVSEETSNEEDEARDGAILDCLDEALTALAAMRAEEGGRLRNIVQKHLKEISKLATAAGENASLQPAALKARLTEQVRALLDIDRSLPEERLAQEAAILATKADIAEELDRLHAHIEAASELLDAGEPVGRRLDFLCQELNREANTVCSKSPDLDLTRIGLDLKAAIERLREQIQNIE